MPKFQLKMSDKSLEHRSVSFLSDVYTEEKLGCFLMVIQRF